MIERQSYYVKPGHFKNLVLVTEALEDPSDYELQVEIKSIGLNFADVFCVLGLYSAAPKHSFIPGLEYAGLIKRVGAKVKKYKSGDKVMGVTRFGAFTSHLNIPEEYVFPLPNDWNYQQGSAYLVQVLTAAYGLLELGNLKPGQNVLIHSAAGGVGLWANRICQNYNCFTIGTVGSANKLPILEQENYARSIVRNPKTFKNELKDALGDRPLNIIMDSIGGRIMKDGYNELGPMGRLIVFGSAHYGERTDRPNYPKLIWKYLQRPKIDPQNMIKENKSVMAFNLIYLFDHTEIMHDLMEKVHIMELGDPIIGGVYAFEDLPNALREFQGGTTIGKQVIKR